MTQFSDDLTNVAISGLRASEDVMHRYAADLIESLQKQNEEMRRRIGELK